MRERSKGEKEEEEGDLPVEEVLPDGPGAALGRRVPAQVRQLLVDPLQGHLGSHRSEKAKIQTECRETGLVLK